MSFRAWSLPRAAKLTGVGTDNFKTTKTRAQARPRAVRGHVGRGESDTHLRVSDVVSHVADIALLARLARLDLTRSRWS